MILLLSIFLASVAAYLAAGQLLIQWEGALGMRFAAKRQSFLLHMIHRQIDRPMGIGHKLGNLRGVLMLRSLPQSTTVDALLTNIAGHLGKNH
jgi:hypothetical protein